MLTLTHVFAIFREQDAQRLSAELERLGLTVEPFTPDDRPRLRWNLWRLAAYEQIEVLSRLDDEQWTWTNSTGQKNRPTTYEALAKSHYGHYRGFELRT